MLEFILLNISRVVKETYVIASQLCATFSSRFIHPPLQHALNSDRNVGHIEKSGTSTQLYKTLATATVWNCTSRSMINVNVTTRSSLFWPTVFGVFLFLHLVFY